MLSFVRRTPADGRPEKDVVFAAFNLRPEAVTVTLGDGPLRRPVRRRDDRRAVAAPPRGRAVAARLGMGGPGLRRAGPTDAGV